MALLLFWPAVKSLAFMFWKFEIILILEDEGVLFRYFSYSSVLIQFAFGCCPLINRISCLVMRRFAVAEVWFICFIYFTAEFGYLHTGRINHLRSSCCSPLSSNGINVSWLIFLHPKPRSWRTERTPCCWWAGAAATSCREPPWLWTAPNLRLPCKLKNQHRRDWNWQTRRDEMGGEGSWPGRRRYQRPGGAPAAASAPSAEAIWHIWRPRACFASMRALFLHLISSDQCTLEAWYCGLNQKCTLGDPSGWII